MTDETGEIVQVRERIAQAEYEFHHPPSNELAWCRIRDEPRFASLVAVYYGRADAVLDALGLERVGFGWCPVHGEALCPEGYMLNRDGEPRADYQHHWAEDMRCGRRQPVYRLTALSGSEGQENQ